MQAKLVQRPYRYIESLGVVPVSKAILFRSFKYDIVFF